MTETVTSPYDVAEHLRTPEEMAAYLEACMEEAAGDGAFVANALGDTRRNRGFLGRLRCARRALVAGAVAPFRPARGPGRG